MNKIISFPYLGVYSFPIKYLIEHITNCKVLIPIKSDETIKIANKYSKEIKNIHFKHILANYIETLENGATILIRDNSNINESYTQIQAKILKKLNYQFTFINVEKNNHISIIKIYKIAKKLNKRLNIILFIYYLLNTILIAIFIEKQDKYLRENIGFEKKKNSFELAENKFYKDMSNNKLSTIKIYCKYKKIYHNIELTNTKRTKIFLTGNAYYLTNTQENNNIERKLAEKGIEIIKYSPLFHLLMNKKIIRKIFLNKVKSHFKYYFESEVAEVVYYVLNNCKQGIDGIIYIIASASENSVLPIINEICDKYNTPLLCLNINNRNIKINIDTKIEMFSDIIINKKETIKIIN